MSFASIRFRLTAWYFCSLAVILGLFALAAWYGMGRSMLKAVDHDLRLRIEDVQPVHYSRGNEHPGRTG